MDKTTLFREIFQRISSTIRPFGLKPVTTPDSDTPFYEIERHYSHGREKWWPSDYTVRVYM